MTQVINRMRRGFYLDSVALMRLSQVISQLAGVEAAALMIGSTSNLRILKDAGLLTGDGETAGANDLVIALRAATIEDAEAAFVRVDDLLRQPPNREPSESAHRSRSLDTAVRKLTGANLALISVPGEFAAVEAHRALARGLHTMIFSDNVSYEDELALKVAARNRGLLVMGPDCGTSLINGVPLAFANEVPRGNIGIVSASGTGLQEVSCLIARMGGGISHGIGTGGRDLSEKIGGLTTLAAIDALDSDSATSHIVLISKPPAKTVVEIVLERVARSAKGFTICFLGAENLSLPANARFAPTLAAAATAAMGLTAPHYPDTVATTTVARNVLQSGRHWIRGIYSGGTLCSEAQVVLRAAGERFWSNVPISVSFEKNPNTGNILLDYGADEYTVGKPHPMIDPTVRNEGFVAALRDTSVAVILLDVVIGYGAAEDPALVIAQVINSVGDDRPTIVASVTGTDLDPQNRSAQVRTLQSAGVLVMPSNAQAAELAVAIGRPQRTGRQSS